VEVWCVEQLRPLAPEAMPSCTGVEFHGGMMDGITKHSALAAPMAICPLVVADGAATVRYLYALPGWRPTPVSGVLTVTDGV
jgi:hypothetical protein